jgi:hypothetical protein
MKKLLLAALAVFISFAVYSQDTLVVESRVFDKASFGLGIGLDHGGIGGNFTIYPQKNIGLFGGLGYAFAGAGYNVGAKIRLASEKHTSSMTPFLIGMYGYNAAVAVMNATQFNKLFYGTTIGIGADFKSRPTKKGYWSFALLIPIRGSQVDNYIKDLKNNHSVEFKNELFPIAISAGYRFILD